MGSGIAEVCARAGYSVVVRVLDPDHAEAGRARIESSMERAVRHGQVGGEDREAAVGRISFVTDLGALADAGLVLEAIPERLEEKRALFVQLAGVCREATILATNSSSLPVIDLGAAFGSPDRVVGLHFFNPAPVMRLVELVETVATAPSVREEAGEFAASLGKTVVACRDRAGFVANLLCSRI
jgi:3-hydroxybutyryl-CoA dehydrogenase